MRETVEAHVMGQGMLAPSLLAAEPFDPNHFISHVPEIEARIVALQPHVIVCGLGPSAWMLRRVRPQILEGIRLWGVNDFFKIMPCHDLTVMDHPVRELLKGSDRWKTVVASRPQRWWLYERCKNHWPELVGERHHYVLKLWKPGKRKDPGPRLTEKPHNHSISSPVGTISIAWSEGLRRIGVIGVDLLEGGHRLSQYHKYLNWFLGCYGKQAKELGGAIVNLSPFSRVTSIQPCKTEQSASGSEPTAGSETPVPSEP